MKFITILDQGIWHSLIGMYSNMHRRICVVFIPDRPIGVVDNEISDERSEYDQIIYLTIHFLAHQTLFMTIATFHQGCLASSRSHNERYKMGVGYILQGRIVITSRFLCVNEHRVLYR